MKDIQREVKALELAMEVATDIQDKSYAYAVARIQEAILGGIVVEIDSEPQGDGYWHAAYMLINSGKALTLSTPEGVIVNYKLPSVASIALLEAFTGSFRKEIRSVPNTWRIFMPDSGAVYLRRGTDEIPMGAIRKGTLERGILDELKTYLETQ